MNLALTLKELGYYALLKIFSKKSSLPCTYYHDLIIIMLNIAISTSCAYEIM